MTCSLWMVSQKPISSARSKKGGASVVRDPARRYALRKLGEFEQRARGILVG